LAAIDTAVFRLALSLGPQCQRRRICARGEREHHLCRRLLHRDRWRPTSQSRSSRSER